LQPFIKHQFLQGKSFILSFVFMFFFKLRICKLLHFSLNNLMEICFVWWTLKWLDPSNFALLQNGLQMRKVEQGQ